MSSFGATENLLSFLNICPDIDKYYGSFGTPASPLLGFDTVNKKKELELIKMILFYTKNDNDKNVLTAITHALFVAYNPWRTLNFTLRKRYEGDDDDKHKNLTREILDKKFLTSKEDSNVWETAVTAMFFVTQFYSRAFFNHEKNYSFWENDHSQIYHLKDSRNSAIRQYAQLLSTPINSAISETLINIAKRNKSSSHEEEWQKLKENLNEVDIKMEKALVRLLHKTGNQYLSIVNFMYEKGGIRMETKAMIKLLELTDLGIQDMVYWHYINNGIIGFNYPTFIVHADRPDPDTNIPKKLIAENSSPNVFKETPIKMQIRKIVYVLRSVICPYEKPGKYILFFYSSKNWYRYASWASPAVLTCVDLNGVTEDFNVKVNGKDEKYNFIEMISRMGVFYFYDLFQG